MQLLQFGERKRSYRETQSNGRSSRSHTVFRIYIGHGNSVAMLNLVDLAGSESLQNQFDKKSVPAEHRRSPLPSPKPSPHQTPARSPKKNMIRKHSKVSFSKAKSSRKTGDKSPYMSNVSAKSGLGQALADTLFTPMGKGSISRISRRGSRTSRFGSVSITRNSRSPIAGYPLLNEANLGASASRYLSRNHTKYEKGISRTSQGNKKSRSSMAMVARLPSQLTTFAPMQNPTSQQNNFQNQ